MKEPGRQVIGPYEIVAPLGAGGMGEVYRAWDPRLQREVALKMLPDDVARDPERRRRLQDEARAAGALNHPNILAVYDVGSETAYIVTELVDGKQLREEIDRGPLPTKRLLELAAQLAAGLGAAHSAGFAHRDLKPENVIVMRDGRAKILDFGLAKTFALASEESLALTRATLTLPGTVVGTPHYMSPEQARGGEVDFRTDQFSLGVVLYEMATGANPFRRETAVQSMSAILADEPRPIAELSPRTPAALRWIIERCLAKEPGDRYASTDDLAKDLHALLRRLPELSAVGTREAAPAGRRPAKAFAAVAVLLLIGAAGAWMRPAAKLPPAMTYKPLVTEMPFQGAPAWSPDGKAVAFVSPVNDVLQVFTKSPDSPFAQPMTESRFDCSDPFWSPDGRRIYYHSLAQDSEGLWAVGAAGGVPEAVMLNAVGATITPDGRTFAFFREEDTPRAIWGSRRAIWIASADGKNEHRYKGPPFDARTFVAGSLRFSPDGTRLLAWVWGWVSEESTAPVTEFWVIPWPEGRGQPKRVLRELGRAAPAAASFDWLPDSRRIVVSLWDGSTTGMHLWTADVDSDDGAPLTSTTRSENRPDVAPDGRTIAFADEEIDFDLIEIPLNGGSARRLLSTSRNELDAAFSPDGSRYAYISDKDGELRIWLRSRDGQFEQPIVGPAQFPGSTTITLGAPAFSPRGDRIAYQRYSAESGYQVWISSVAAAGNPSQLGSGSLYQDAPAWSPDGTEIAFVGRIKGITSGLLRARVGGTDPPVVILPSTPLLSSRPAWSPDGAWIACQTQEGLIIVRPDGGQMRPLSDEGWIAFAWDLDSRRIIGLREAERSRHFALVSLNIETLEERIINPDLGVIPPASQPIRGLAVLKSGVVVTSIANARSDIVMGTGFAPAALRWWERLLPGRRP